MHQHISSLGILLLCQPYGLDKVVVATTPEFDDLITDLKNFEFHEPKPVNIIDSSQIVTMERVDSIINK